MVQNVCFLAPDLFKQPTFQWVCPEFFIFEPWHVSMLADFKGTARSSSSIKSAYEVETCSVKTAQINQSLPAFAASGFLALPQLRCLFFLPRILLISRILILEILQIHQNHAFVHCVLFRSPGHLGRRRWNSHLAPRLWNCLASKIRDIYNLILKMAYLRFPQNQE